jgi:hypothetical protein
VSPSIDRLYDVVERLTRQVSSLTPDPARGAAARLGIRI